MTAPDCLPAQFASPEAYRRGFEDGLTGLAQSPVLGAYILALANASFEPRLLQRMRPALADGFRRWHGHMLAADAAWQAAAPDDVAVFQRLAETGFDRLQATRWRQAGPWRLQYNPLRALRPRRMSGARVEGVMQPFDPAAFHFNKPFLRDEMLWQGGLPGLPVARLFYNKFPFVEGHALLVPEPDAELPQYLTAQRHRQAWSVCQAIGRSLPGIGFGYNAFGAYASVNHLHFQAFVMPAPGLPVEQADWRHNGGDRPYPLEVSVCDSVEGAWRLIDALHDRGCAYNLVYRPGRVYLVARARQGEVELAGWLPNPGWTEVAGLLSGLGAGDFDVLSGPAIEQELARLRAPGCRPRRDGGVARAVLRRPSPAPRCGCPAVDGWRTAPSGRNR